MFVFLTFFILNLFLEYQPKTQLSSSQGPAAFGPHPVSADPLPVSSGPFPVSSGLPHSLDVGFEKVNFKKSNLAEIYNLFLNALG